MSLADKVKQLYGKIPSQKKILNKGRSAAITTLKATKIKNEDYFFKKIGYSLLNFVGHHQLIGCLPGKIQKELTEESGIPKTVLTWESIGLGILLGVIKYASGDAVIDTDLTLGGYLLQGWGVFRLAEAGIRMAYTTITKEPLGLLAVELIYKLSPSHYSFKEEKKTAEKLEDTLYKNIISLNTRLTLDNY